MNQAKARPTCRPWRTHFPKDAVQGDGREGTGQDEVGQVGIHDSVQDLGPDGVDDGVGPVGVLGTHHQAVAGEGVKVRKWLAGYVDGDDVREAGHGGPSGLPSRARRDLRVFGDARNGPRGV